MRVVHPLLAAALLFVSCTPTPSSTWVNSSGSVALSRDDALVYAADADNGTLTVVDARARTKVAELKVGAQPERVLVGPNDTVYVANRGSRSVSVITRGSWEAPSATVAVGVEPVGLALADNGKTLLVVNATALDSVESGTLMAFDAQSLQLKWEVKVGDEPRGVAVVRNDEAVVALSRKGRVVRVNLSTHEVVDTVANLSALANTPPGSGGPSAMSPPVEPGSMGSSTVQARNLLDVVASPDGQRVYAPVVWASDQVLDGDGNAGGSPGYGSSSGGGCGGTGSIASPGLVTLESAGSDMDPKVDPAGGCVTDADFPPSVFTDPQLTPQGPTALAVDASGQWIFTANRESDTVTVVPAYARASNVMGGNVTQSVPVPAGPTGIAITRDGKTAWVYSAFDHQLVPIESQGTGSAQVLVPGEPITVAGDTLPADAVRGRKLFFSARDPRMNAVGISCATCHVDGREDGHTWNFTEGPRQTPMLSGRKLGLTAPYHWAGEFPDFTAFVSHTVGRRMGGSGPGPEGERQLLAFIDTMATPDNPFRGAAPTAAQARGEAVFNKAGCNTCHSGDALTNERMADVGTFVQAGAVVDDLNRLSRGLNTPSLLGLGRSAPYLHDGSVDTLKERILRGKQADQHGVTSTLTSAEVDDLVEYLQAL
jgi:YVTN family beta-propeller protein